MRTISFFLFFTPVILSSCSSEQKTNQAGLTQENSTAEHTVVADLSITPLLYQKWTDEKDSSHQVIFADKNWVDLYFGDTVSVKPFRLYTNFIDKGGKESDEGKYMRLEESPGNFYDFHIEQLDSMNLRLNFITADQEMTFKKAEGNAL